MITLTAERQPVRGSAGGARALPSARPRDLCTDCGISRSSDPGRCGRACQFIHPRYGALETQAHGRARDTSDPDELHFGPFLEMLRADLRTPAAGAQWTGIATRLGALLLENDIVDAVLATGSDPDDRWKPVPVLVTRAEDMARCRGMKMGFSPVLALLDDVARLGLRRIAMIGIPCQVHALRALESELGLDRLYIIGTPCSDNTTTERFHDFLNLLSDRPDEVSYLEFRTDYRVELRFDDGARREIPFIDLPIRDLPDDFFPLTCRSCFDYANTLSDITVGYMGGDGSQWLIVRNEKGRELVTALGDELSVHPPVEKGRRAGAVGAFKKALDAADGGLPARRAPRWARPMIDFAMRRFGPKGTEFARARVEMKAIEGVLALRRERPTRMKRMIPQHAWLLAEPYGIAPGPGETVTDYGSVDA